MSFQETARFLRRGMISKVAPTNAYGINRFQPGQPWVKNFHCVVHFVTGRKRSRPLNNRAKLSLDARQPLLPWVWNLSLERNPG
jgi:hypothetical protein